MTRATCPACGTVVYADVPRWAADTERRLALLFDRHQPVPGSEPKHCNACGDLWPCVDARILAGMEAR